MASKHSGNGGGGFGKATKPPFKYKPKKVVAKKTKGKSFPYKPSKKK